VKSAAAAQTGSCRPLGDAPGEGPSKRSSSALGKLPRVSARAYRDFRA